MLDEKLVAFLSTENFRKALGAFLERQRWYSRGTNEAECLQIEVLSVSLPSGMSWWHVTKGKDTYRVPIAWHPDSTFIDANAKIAIDPASGWAVSDAFFHTEFTAWLLGVSTQDNLLDLDLKDSLSEVSRLPSDPLEATVNQNNQTNTCVFYRDKYFLKFYRKVELGWNHECATLKALKSIQRHQEGVTPTLLAEVRYEQSTLWSLQVQVANASNLWSCCVTSLKRLENTLPTHHENLTSSNDAWYSLMAYASAAGQSLGLLHRQMSLLEVGETIRLKLSPLRLFSDWQRLLKEWNTSNALNQATLREIEPLKTLWQRYSLAPNREIDVSVQRIHGDLHLGQMLWTQDATVVITDFDGEPIRDERETKSSRLSPCEEDVAAMLRSWEYLLDHRDETALSQDQRSQMKFLLKQQFLHAYQGTLEPQDEASFMSIQLDALHFAVLAKCLRECEYEWRYRPDWLIIPLRGMAHHLNQQLHG